MARTCEECGESFETLTRYRLHDCSGSEGERSTDQNEADWEREREQFERQRQKRKQSREKRARRAASTALTSALERAESGDPDAVYTLLGQYERHLSDAASAESYDRYWQLHEGLFDPASSAIEAIVDEEGWPYLLDILEAYWPETAIDLDAYSDPEFQSDYVDTDEYPFVSHVLTGVTGRHTIRTRREREVSAIPAAALEFLLCYHCFGGDNGAWVESMSYGWGIGHPEHPVGENLSVVVEGDYDIWAGAAIEHALHADQYAATALLEDIFEAGIASDPAMLLRGVGAIDRGRYPEEPSDWDWTTVYPEFEANGFDWDPDVKERLRELVVESDLHHYLPDDWTLADIEV